MLKERRVKKESQSTLTVQEGITTRVRKCYTETTEVFIGNVKPPRVKGTPLEEAQRKVRIAMRKMALLEAESLTVPIVKKRKPQIANVETVLRLR